MPGYAVRELSSARSQTTEGSQSPVISHSANVSITYINQTANAVSPRIIISHTIPPPPTDFTGREELLSELEALTDAPGFVISRMGGVDKTVLALKLAQHLQPRYGEFQFYLDVEGLEPKPLSRRQIMVLLIQAAAPDLALPSTRLQLKQLYQSVLQERRRAILIFDNVKDEDQIRALLPPPAGALMIVTSRKVRLAYSLVERPAGACCGHRTAAADTADCIHHAKLPSAASANVCKCTTHQGWPSPDASRSRNGATPLRRFVG